MTSLSAIASDFMAGSRSKALNAALAKGHTRACAHSLAGSSAAMLLASLANRPSPLLVIGDSPDDAGYLYHDLSRLLGEEAVLILPSGYKRAIKYGQPDPPSQILRTEALSAWQSASSPVKIVVTYPEALAEKVAPPQMLAEHTLRLSLNSPVDLTEVIKWLRNNNFSEVDYVYEPGHFAHRGSILDIFGYSHELPYRIDFFGDEIDSIRTFNIETQLSEEKLDSVSITANVAHDPNGTSLLKFIPSDTLIAVRDAAFTTARIREVASESLSTSTVIAEEGDTDAMSRVIDAEAFARDFNSFTQLSFTAAASSPDPSAVAIDFQCSPQGIYHKNFDIISDSFSRFLDDGYEIFILSDSDKQIERLKEIFADRGDKIKFSPVIPTLHEGFVDHLKKRCIFTDHQIFDRFHKYNLRSDRARSGKLALSLKELSAIEPGDYIVHVDHGVGKFAGLLRTNVNGHMQEMIKLVYAHDDIIFVSIHSLHKLAKYRGKEGVPPKINTLGTGAWNRVKERTKSKLKDIARDLIKLYAARKQEQGFGFSPDTYMQQELEASFIYEDTPDQLTATQAVKADMESQRPMDRLICGDVGFGKTEIAIRAAFKAAADSKQTAVLVPTTVLAYQHYHTFSKRLKDFPVRVEYLSRARSAKDTKQILADLADGKIDIIIGTHKLVGKSVKFKDLGLLVVDEEQKFGVAVKEKLKQLKTNVDTLTMSATPIPRTLQFSLMGARDLSAITTPPANRYPIVTNVSALSDDLITEAINFEMSRNGQVFVINNRIEGLNELESMIRRLVPDARIVVGHGQMPPEKLEKAIEDFANHDYDVLLATTIVESGIDMPNVNTIIINNAQNFGLSELHQLRGRVGRSSRKAFCYLSVPPHVPLAPVARRRLQAIESFSDLGSGIHIAMQDLDIRGAGNLLGAEQSGFIADLGYETYQKILREAVTELRTEEFADLDNDSVAEPEDFVADCVIESDMELLLPADYVPQESERISLYQELDSIERELDLQAFKTRLQDRFGKVPQVTLELLRIPRLRRLARKLGIEKVALKQSYMYTYFVDDSNKAYYQSPMFGRMLHYLQQHPRQCAIREKNGKRSFSFSNVTSVEQAVDILQQILDLNSI
ncbi:MAG: transcription-repair coupling factor [Muribaculaceae bacterium]|jgi:transcription-repair coupling factor (superfamily II helicase)|nr:transcription-repair coupling factor [Muribaculaceae bacterium]